MREKVFRNDSSIKRVFFSSTSLFLLPTHSLFLPLPLLAGLRGDGGPAAPTATPVVATTTTPPGETVTTAAPPHPPTATDTDTETEDERGRGRGTERGRGRGRGRERGRERGRGRGRDRGTGGGGVERGTIALPLPAHLAILHPGSQGVSVWVSLPVDNEKH